MASRAVTARQLMLVVALRCCPFVTRMPVCFVTRQPVAHCPCRHHLSFPQQATSAAAAHASPFVFLSSGNIFLACFFSPGIWFSFLGHWTRPIPPGHRQGRVTENLDSCNGCYVPPPPGGGFPFGSRF